MKRVFPHIVWFALLPLLLTAREIKVTYISNQSIYIDGGRADGIRVGDSLIVKHNGKPTTLLKVKYVAEHSASAAIEKGKMPKKDDAIVLLTKRSTSKPRVATGRRERHIKTNRSSFRSDFKSRAKVSGSISLNWRHIKDVSDRKASLDQPGARFNIKIKNLFGQAYELRIKSRLRYQRRTFTYGDRLPKEEWRNRLYVVFFSYTDENALLNYSFGRILSNAIGSVGYIDGALVQARLVPALRLGLFAGTQFQGQNSNIPSGKQKYGAFVRYIKGDYRAGRWESAATLSGEYVHNTIDRELLYFMNSFYTRRFSFYQSADIDINNGWRQDRAGEKIALSNLYLNGHIKFTRKISASLSYDNRKNYYSYRWRSIADSLFDDALRQGLRASINLRLPQQIQIMINGGVRIKENDDQKTFSYSGSVTKRRITRWRAFVGLYGSGFSNAYTQGYYASTRIGANLRSGHSFDVSYGGYFYTTRTTQESRASRWVRANLNLNFGRHWFMSPNYEYFFGDDSPGHRLYIEAGYRL